MSGRFQRIQTEDNCPAEEKVSDLTPFLPSSTYFPSKSVFGREGAGAGDAE
jgi:hypothetical protein